jgi:hypothetical protein
MNMLFLASIHPKPAQTCTLMQVNCQAETYLCDVIYCCRECLALRLKRPLWPAQNVVATSMGRSKKGGPEEPPAFAL